MYTVLDLDRLAVVHRHPDFEVACNLADIEFQDSTLCIAVVDTIKFFFTYTETDLLILYRNLTGSQTLRKGNELRALLVEAIHRLPATDAKATEVDRQADYATANRAAGPYTYVKGATRPAKATNPIVATVLPAACEIAAMACAKGVAADVQQGRKPIIRKSTEPSPQQGKSSSAPRGGVRSIIWDKADTLWALAGNPTDKAEVMALRKTIMDALEGDGVKRTSSSNELGNWQKARVAKIS